MAGITIKGDTSGEITLNVPATAGTNTITIPASSGTLAVTSPGGDASFPGTLSAGTISATGNISTPSGTVTASSFSGDGSSLTGIAGGFSNIEVFTSSGTWTNPGNVTKVKVTVVGAGGGGSQGAILALGATAIGGDGGTSSFGAYCSATGGYGGVTYRAPGPVFYNYPGAGGIGSGGDLNFRGGVGQSTEVGDGFDKGIIVGGDTYVGSGAVYAPRGPASVVSSVGYYGGGGVYRYSNGQFGAQGGGGGTAIEVITIPTSPVPITVGTAGSNLPASIPAPTAPTTTSLAGGNGVVIVEY